MRCWPIAGLAGSRTSAAASVRAGRVRIGRDGPRRVEAEPAGRRRRRAAGRGGAALRLARRAQARATRSMPSGIDVPGRACLDVGASTGGFTDCLLQRGAARVIALDVGHGQLDWRLRNDPRVEVMERVNARDLRPADLPFAPELATVDVSFISLAKVLPAVAGLPGAGGRDRSPWSSRSSSSGAGRVRRRGGPLGRRAPRGGARRWPRGASGSGSRFGASRRPGCPGPKGNRETFIWCGAGGERIDDLEAAIDEVGAMSAEVARPRRVAGASSSRTPSRSRPSGAGRGVRSGRARLVRAARRPPRSSTSTATRAASLGAATSPRATWTSAWCSAATARSCRRFAPTRTPGAGLRDQLRDGRVPGRGRARRARAGPRACVQRRLPGDGPPRPRGRRRDREADRAQRRLASSASHMAGSRSSHIGSEARRWATSAATGWSPRPPPGRPATTSPTRGRSWPGE